MNRQSRRTFVRTLAAGAGALWAAPALSYGRIVGANDRVNVAAIGANSRGDAVAQSFARLADAEVTCLCDVDRRVFDRVAPGLTKRQGRAPKNETDFRRVLDDATVDAVLIATPDHWHAPMAILALQAGKHVYLEKPCSHNPKEGELLLEAERRSGRLVQMGTQQRSAPESIRAVELIRSGVIGRPYFARTWYSNARESIGRGKPAPVPAWLDHELWQGPAPRRPFRDNVVHYNWHWFHHWGTGEACNNGTHEVDFSRWALGAGFPVRVASNGGRYHFQDDWEFPDTQMVSFDFPDGQTLTWEGRSCNGFPVEGRGRGSLVHGTEGTLLVDRDGYVRYDLKNREVERVQAGAGADPLNPVGADVLTDYHVRNFLDAVRTGARLNAPIIEGHRSVVLCQLANIAQAVGRSLQIDPQTGHILDDPEAARLWSRTYEPGWEPRLG